jgi:GGDEF domain-containing protein
MLWSLPALMVNYVIRVFLVIFFSVACCTANSTVPTNAIPNWFTLENQLYQSPMDILEQLRSMDIESWTDKHKVQYFDLLSNAYVVLSDYPRAREAFDQGWLLKERAEPYTLVNLLTSKGYFKELEDDLEGAVADYHTALRIAEQSGSFDAMMVALNSLVSFYSFSQEQYDTALSYVERASQISQSVSREFLVADLYNYFGSILSYLGDPEGALKQYRIAEAIYLKLDNNVSLSTMLYNRALVHYESENYISALRTYQAFISKAENWGDPTAQFFGKMGIANSYSYLERFDQAYEAILEAESGLEFIVDNMYLFDFWTSVIYIAADVEDFEYAQEGVNQAEELLSVITEEDQTWYHSQLLDGRKYLAVMESDYELAYELSEELLWLQYDLLEREQEDAINELRINSENAMYQAETDRLANESRQQREIIAGQKQFQKILIFLLVTLLVSVIVLWVSLRRKLHQMRILQQYSAISESVKTSGQRVMENVASLMFDQSERRKIPLSVVIFDFSSMSDVREQFGEQAVEAANSWIKETLESEMREEDKCGQLSFGRYMMLLPGAETRLAKKHSDRMVQYFKDHTVPNWPAVSLDVSVGISERSRHDRNPNVLTHRATAAVDMAKDQGMFSIKVLAV